MAVYRVLAKSYINNRIVEAGEEIEFEGKVRKDFDQHLEPVKGSTNEKKQAADRQAVDDATRAEAINLNLTEDGKADGKPIDGETPIDIVELRLGEYKQANVFK